MIDLADVSEIAYRRCLITALAVGSSPLDLAEVWFSESGWHANAHNPHGDAVGFCQMMPDTLRGLGYVGTWETFARLALEEQIQPWGTRYYRPYTNKMTSSALAYLATFLPAYLDEGYRARNGIGDLAPDTIIAGKLETGKARLGWAYTANAVFDADHNGAITLGELDLAIKRACVGARWQAIAENVARVSSLPAPSPATLPMSIDLTTPLSLQRGLSLLGYPLAVDGARGPLTISATRAFQTAHGLVPDGLVGPLTRRALLADLAALAP
jgi:hypothetical protein